MQRHLKLKNLHISIFFYMYKYVIIHKNGLKKIKFWNKHLLNTFKVSKSQLRILDKKY